MKFRLLKDFEALFLMAMISIVCGIYGFAAGVQNWIPYSQVFSGIASLIASIYLRDQAIKRKARGVVMNVSPVYVIPGNVSLMAVALLLFGSGAYTEFISMRNDFSSKNDLVPFNIAVGIFALLASKMVRAPKEP
ncbi:MAG: hypothetical protein NVSMB64_12220 [Candidatus Velthaea sp.]